MDDQKLGQIELLAGDPEMQGHGNLGRDDEEIPLGSSTMTMWEPHASPSGGAEPGPARDRLEPTTPLKSISRTLLYPLSYEGPGEQRSVARGGRADAHRATQ